MVLDSNIIISYYNYRSFDGKYQCFTIIGDRDNQHPKFLWAVEGEQIIYSFNESKTKAEIGELIKHEI